MTTHLRWKIEEFFKYKKQQFNLEKIKIRKYRRLKAMNRILTISMFLSNIINIKDIGNIIKLEKRQIRKHVAFKLYKVSEGIKKIFKITRQKLMDILYPKPLPRRRDLFTVCGLRFSC